MTVEEFKAALTALGWKQIDFCRKTGVATTTVSRWVVGESEIPRWVPQYLGMVGDVVNLYDKYAKKPARMAPEQEGESGSE